ncbi:pilus assembly protein PilP, partial [Halorubrum sp. Atlit-28R]
MTRFRLPAVLIVPFLFTLNGCGGDGDQEVQQWMEEVKRETKVSIPKLSEPKKFAPFIYSAKDAIDPYNQSKLTVAL